MKPRELYKRKPERIDKDINCLYGCYYNHVPEIEDFSHGVYIEDGLNKRIEIHYYKDFCFDGRRTWVLAAVKFDDKFVMIIQNAGREGDDHTARFITNKNRYIKMVKYIKSIIPVEPDDDIRDMFNLDDDITILTSFYGNDLDGEFKQIFY